MNDLPHRVDAEQSVLGGLLIDNAALVRVSDWLSESDFYLADHRTIYRAILTLGAKGDPFDWITLAEHVDADSVDGGASYVMSLATNTPSAANVVAYAEIVVEQSRRRQAMDVASNLLAAAHAGTASADMIATAQQHLSTLSVDRASGPQPAKVFVKRWFADISDRYLNGRKFTGRLTPWKEVNELTLGLKPSNLIVVAGRPGMGKSILGSGLAAFDALRGGRPLLFSLEMSGEEVIEREVAALGELPHEWLRNPDKEAKDEYGQFVSDGYWSKASRVAQDLMASALVIDEQESLTIQQIVARAKREHIKAPLTMVVVDHLHIVGIKGKDTVRELGDISRGLKGLAKALGIPVVALAQLNRANTARADKRPTMSDLRASGEIEQDADYILLLHREDYYDENSHMKGVVELIVGKARHSRARTIHMLNRMDQMRIEDWVGPLPEKPEAVNARQAQTGFRNRPKAPRP